MSHLARTACAALASLAVLLLAAASPAGAIVPLGQFGEGPGDQAGLLGPALGVAIDPAGRVYVSELDRISVFSPRGAFLRAFGKDVVPGNASTRFEQCTTVCQDGEPGGDSGALDGAAGIATDSEGLLYVAEAANARISVFNQQGAFVRAFGEEGTAGGELRNPQSVTIDDDVLWVPDPANARVSLYTREGTFLRAFGKRVNRALGGRTDRCSSRCGPGVATGDAGALLGPLSVALDAAGNVYVSELLNRRVSVFSPDLAFLRAFGSDVVPGNAQTGFEVCTTATGCKAGTTGAVFAPGNGPQPVVNGPGVLNQPGGVAIGPDAALYVTEAVNRRVSVFSPGPSFLRAFGKNVVPGNTGTGFEQCTTRCTGGAAGAGPGEMTNPELLAFDCRGALYVAEDANGRVERFGEPGTPNPPCVQPAALRKPFGIMRVRADARTGTARLTISVPWSCELRLRGRVVRTAVKQVEFRGRTRLVVRPRGAAKRRLHRTGRARVRVKVTYWPWGGKRRTKTVAVVLRR
ncbi:MAG TPA: NHL repeat-containing protein [Thermoleophilaceae bacterium]|jgi:DNA-binding beta-propeller fold protein YncE